MVRYITSLSNCVDSNVGVNLSMAVNVDVGSGGSVIFSADNGISSSSGNRVDSNGSNILSSNSGNSMSCDVSNSVSFNVNNGMSFGSGNCVGSSSGNNIDFGIEVDTSGNLGEELVCLGTQLARMAIGLVFSEAYIVTPTFFVIGYSHFILASLVSQVIKPLYLLSSTKAVSILVAIWSFENT